MPIPPPVNQANLQIGIEQNHAPQAPRLQRRQLPENQENIRQNPLNGGPLPRNVGEAREQQFVPQQGKTPWLKKVALTSSVLLWTLPRLSFNASKWVYNKINGPKNDEPARFQVTVPQLLGNATNLNFDGKILPSSARRGMRTQQLQTEVQEKINAGYDLLQKIKNDEHNQRATKEDISNIMFYIQAKGELTTGKSTESCAYNIPDPGCKIRKFLDSCPDSYQRASTHLKDFQKLDGGKHRGIDLTAGGRKSLSEFLPFGKETLMFGSLPKNENLSMTEDRLFLKMEWAGCPLKGPSSGYDKDGPRRAAKFHDVQIFVDHTGTTIASKLGIHKGPSQKERVPKDITKAYIALQKIDELKEGLSKNKPIVQKGVIKRKLDANKSAGIRIMYANAKNEYARLNNWEVGRPDEKNIDTAVKLKTFIEELEKNYTHLDVRIGNEVIFDN